MFTFVNEYLKTYDQFELFGLSHWAAIFLFLLLVFLLPWYAKNYLNANQQNRVGIVLGLIVGFIAAIMGVGGAFLLVPAMIYIIGMPTKLVPGTSLFVTIFITAIVVVLHAINYQSIDLVLVTTLIFGSIIGVQIGLKIGEYLDSSELKTLLAILLLFVGVAMAYDTFFRNQEIVLNNINTNIVEKNQLYDTIINLSINHPITYGLFSIILAVGLGVLGSVLRRSISIYRKKFLI